MARSEARLSVSIWTDPDFLALTPTAQRMFLFLLSQPDLTHDGVLALRERRWSKTALGLTRPDVERDLAALAAARFVVIDEDAEELLIRSFIRRDKVFRQPNVLRAAQDHLEVVTSPIIRSAIGVELRRIIDSGELKGEAVRVVADMLDAIGNPSGNPSPNPSGGVSASPGNPSGKAAEEGLGGADEASSGSDAGNRGPKRRDQRQDGQTHGRPVDTFRDVDVCSPAIRTANDATTESVAPRTQGSASDRRTTIDAGEDPSGNPSPNPSGNPSPNPSAATPGERGVVTAVRIGSPFPDSPGPVPLPSAARPGGDVIDAELVDAPRALAVVTDEPINAGHITKRWIDHCTAHKVKLTDQLIKRYGAGIKSALAQNFTPSLIEAALAQMLTDRVASRPSLFDNYLVRAQQGAELPPRRMSRAEESAARLTPDGTTPGQHLYDILTRPA